MSSARITIPYPEEDAKVLIEEAKAQDRTFSGYMQKVITEHMIKENENGSDDE